MPKLAGVTRARLLGLVAATAVLPLVAAACGGSDQVAGTLPPIVTTTTTTTVLETTTTVQRFYVVQSGDTLSKIAQRFGVAIEDLMAINGITNPDHIEAGQTLEIPPPRVVLDSLPTATTTTSTATTSG